MTTLAKFTHIVRSFNEFGLGGLIDCMAGKQESKEVTIRLKATDQVIFHLIEKRISKTRLVKSISGVKHDFDVQSMGFLSALDTARNYLAFNKNPKKAEHYATITYEGDLQSCQAIVLVIRNKENKVMLSSLITGLLS